MDRRQVAAIVEAVGQVPLAGQGLVAAVTVFVGIAEEWKQRNGPETGGCDGGTSSPFL
jgi:hypothetical protein